MAQIITGLHSTDNRENVSWLLHQGKTSEHRGGDHVKTISVTHSY